MRNLLLVDITIFAKVTFITQELQRVAVADVILVLLSGGSWVLTCIYSYVPVDQLLLMENAFVTGKDNPFKKRLYNMVKQIYIYLRGKYLTSIPSLKMSTLLHFVLSKKKNLSNLPLFLPYSLLCLCHLLDLLMVQLKVGGFFFIQGKNEFLHVLGCIHLLQSIITFTPHNIVDNQPPNTTNSSSRRISDTCEGYLFVKALVSIVKTGHARERSANGKTDADEDLLPHTRSFYNSNHSV